MTGRTIRPAPPAALIRCAAALCLWLAAVPAPAHAETTGWAMAEGGRMRMVALPPEPDGTVRAALQIAPDPGWITYWREPGESGIPPQLTVRGATLASLSYPVPKILSLGTLKDIGYDKPVTLPVTLSKVTGDVEIDVFAGVCNEICVPFQAGFGLQLRPGPQDAAEKAIVDAALASLPQGPAEDFRIDSTHFESDKLTLSLSLPHTDEPVEAIVTGPGGLVFTAMAKAGETSLAIPLTGLSPTADRAAMPWRALLKSGKRAVEQEIEHK